MQSVIMFATKVNINLDSSKLYAKQKFYNEYINFIVADSVY